MLSFFARLLNTDDFPARWHCGNWSSAHGWLHICSDLAVWSAYFAIPCILIYFATRKRDLPFRGVFWLFGAFILACGTTHLMEAVIFWWPAYRLAGTIKLATAIVSWATVIALVPIVPQVLAMRSPESLEREVRRRTAELHQANEALQREVQERKHAEGTLHDQREWLRVTLSSIGDAVIAADAAGQITFLNPTAETLTGWNADQAVSRPLTTVFGLSGEIDEPRVTPLDSVLQGRAESGPAERSTLVSRSGRHISVEYNYAPMRDEDGQIRGVVLVFRDVTARRHAEQRLHILARAGETLASNVDSVKLLQEVANLAVPAVADWCSIELRRDDGSVEHDVRVHTDPALQCILERMPLKPHTNEFSARSQSTTIVTTDEQTIAAALPIEIQPDSNSSPLVPHALIRLPLAVRGRQVGEITFVYTGSERSYTNEDAALAEDLARRTAAAVENARLYAELQEADRRKNEFLAMLAHELRNPLAPIRNALVVLTESEAGEQTRRELFAVMTHQVDHMVRMVDDLLDVSRIMRGKIELRVESVRVEDVIERAWQTVKPMYEENEQTLELELPQSDLRVKGDLVRLSQVVSNLLHNAGKYSPRKTTIRLRVEADAAGVAIRIRDEGMGIDAAQLTNIFDLFTQSDRSIQRATGGLGIGLTVVRSIVEMHGGTVEARSDGLDRGSEFIVRLAKDDSATDPRHTEWKPKSMPALRILVIEDNVGSARTLALMLQKIWKHEVAVAYDGSTGMEIADTFDPDLILMDIGMPGLSGYEVAKRLRAKTKSSKVTLVALTGYGQAEDRRKSREAGFDDHLVKPVSVTLLETVFSKVVRRSSTSTTAD